jgi:hypothetical protein
MEKGMFGRERFQTVPYEATIFGLKSGLLFRDLIPGMNAGANGKALPHLLFSISL